jgi:DNA-binding NtrC family response regulator
LRQLHGVLRTACALLEADEFSLDWRHLPDDIAGALRTRVPMAQAGLSQTAALASALPEARLKRLSRQAIRQVAADTGGNMSAAASRLRISRNTL